MKVPDIHRTSAAGLCVAIALLLIAVQAVIEVLLLLRNEPGPNGFRRWHLATALILVLLAGTDIILNG
jgi:hypothetical protein